MKRSTTLPKYLKRSLEHALGQDGLVMADIGARFGLDEDLACISSLVSALGFEPDAEEVEKINEAEGINWRSARVFPYAIGGQNGEANLYLTENPQAASLLPHNADMVEEFGYPGLHIDRSVMPVKIVTLDSLLEEGSLTRVDYLKIDIEGAELDVLCSAKAVLANCVGVKVECSFLEQRIDQPLIWDVAQFLNSHGFNIVDLQDIHHWRRGPTAQHPFVARTRIRYSRGRLAQCDVIALKKDSHCSSPAAKIRLIVLSAALGFFDHAFHLLKTSSEELPKSVCSDLENTVTDWSKIEGRRVAYRSFIKRARGFVPAIKSIFGGIKPPSRHMGN